MGPAKFSLKSRLNSFRYALRGLLILFREQHNARIHAFAALLVIILGIIFDVTVREWILLVFAIGLVFISELFNSAIESLADAITPDRDDMIKKAKDYGAAGVLVSALIALITGVAVFLPGILRFF